MSLVRPTFAAAILGLLSVTIPVPLGAQSPPGCEGKGTEAPAWFGAPPEPRAGVYQAEARSGGCADAEAAQKVAARLASWLLVREKSWRAVLEEVRVTRRRTGVGRGTDLTQELQVVEHGVARKILKRSWVHRQATRWTEAGRAEHFLIVRADTAALRAVAADELEQYLADRERALGTGDARPSDGELRWATLNGPAEARVDNGTKDSASSSTESTLYDLLGFTTGPPLKGFVLSWQADPTADRFALDQMPLEARLGLRLTPAESGWYATLGGRYVRGEDRQFAIGGSETPFKLEDRQTFEGAALVGAPRQLVPVYAGFRYGWSVAGPKGTLRDRETALGYLGLGYPPFTELSGTRIRNLYAQAGLVPHFSSLEAGGRVVLAELPGTAIHTLFRIATSVREVGSAGVMGLSPGDDRLMASELVASGGLELRVGGTVGVFALVRLDRSELTRASEHDVEEYAQLFRSFETVGTSETRTGFRVGLRLAF